MLVHLPATFHKKKPILKQFHLSDLREKCPKLPPKRCDSMAEAGAIAFENQSHESGVELLVDGPRSEKFTLTWDAPDARGDWPEMRELANEGAVAVALSLVFEMTDFEVIRQSRIGTGFDYLLGYQENHPSYDSDNFLAARLEISGIKNGTTNEIAQRVRDKMKQTNASDSLGLPAYVALTEFSKPVAIFKKK